MKLDIQDLLLTSAKIREKLRWQAFERKRKRIQRENIRKKKLPNEYKIYSI